MSKRHSVKIDLPKVKSTNHYWNHLDERLQNVPDKAKVTITQSQKGGVIFVVITTKGNPPAGLIDTLVSGKPGTKVNASGALSFEMPLQRSNLLYEAYYSKNDSSNSSLTFHWDKK